MLIGRMTPEIPADADWVNQRNECTAKKMFEALETRVRADVAERGATLTTIEKQRGVRFHVETGDTPGYFYVLAEATKRLVRFYLRGETIEISGEGFALEEFNATVTLTPACECRFVVDGEELAAWQVSRKALEALLFA